MSRFHMLLCMLCMLTCLCVAQAGWFFPSSSSSASSGPAAAEEGEEEGDGYDRLTARAPGLSAAYAGRQLAESHVRAEALWSKVEQRGQHSHCWRAALQALRQDCAAIQKQDSLRSRLALALASCDEESDGRTHATFLCGAHRDVRSCVGGLSELGYSTFLQYRLHVDVLCGYLQEELARQRTEAAVHALHSQTEQTVYRLHEMEKTGQSILHGMSEYQQAQATSLKMTQGLHDALRELGATQKTTLQTLRSSAQDVQASTERAGGALRTLQETLQHSTAKAAQSVEQLQSHVLAQYAAMEEHSAGLLHILRRIESVQQLIASRTFSLHDIGLVVLSVTAVWLISSAPRTAAARLPALLCILVGCAGPAAVRLLLSLTSFYSGGYAHSGKDARMPQLIARVQMPWLRVSIAMAFGVVCYVAAHHTAPHILQRRLLREELGLALQEHQQYMMRWLEQRGVVDGGTMTKCGDDVSLVCGSTLCKGAVRSPLPWGMGHRLHERTYSSVGDEVYYKKDMAAIAMSAGDTPRLTMTPIASQSRCLSLAASPAAARHSSPFITTPSSSPPWAGSVPQHTCSAPHTHAGAAGMTEQRSGCSDEAARFCNASTSSSAATVLVPSSALLPEAIDTETATDTTQGSAITTAASTPPSTAPVAVVSSGARPAGRRVRSTAGAKRPRSTTTPARRRRRRDA